MINQLRALLNENKPTLATRVSTVWPTAAEAIGSTGRYDYVEFLAEYNPYSLADFENFVRACELHDLGSIIKVDFQNRAYVAQKALASGFQGILFADCRTPEDVAECIRLTMPDCPKYGGAMGYPNNRWIRYTPNSDQMDYAEMAASAVRLFMIEKKEAVDNIEKICGIPGVDMIQFGPSDYSMSIGKNMKETTAEYKAVERHCIQVALAHGVQPRCEIQSASDFEYYRELGVKHVCLGDQMRILRNYWSSEGEALRRALP